MHAFWLAFPLFSFGVAPTSYIMGCLQVLYRCWSSSYLYTWASNGCSGHGLGQIKILYLFGRMAWCDMPPTPPNSPSTGRCPIRHIQFMGLGNLVTCVADTVVLEEGCYKSGLCSSTPCQTTQVSPRASNVCIYARTR